jgi:hypothetical protein
MHMHNSFSQLLQPERVIQRIMGISLLYSLPVSEGGHGGHERVYRMDRVYRLYLLLGYDRVRRGYWGMRICPADVLGLLSVN